MNEFLKQSKTKCQIHLQHSIFIRISIPSFLNIIIIIQGTRKKSIIPCITELDKKIEKKAKQQSRRRYLSVKQKQKISRSNVSSTIVKSKLNTKFIQLPWIYSLSTEIFHRIKINVEKKGIRSVSAHTQNFFFYIQLSTTMLLSSETG